MPKGQPSLAGGLAVGRARARQLGEHGLHRGRASTLLDRARATARELVEGLKPGDTASVVLAGRKAGGPEVLFPEPTPALGDVLQAIDSVQVATLGTDLSGAVARAEAVALAGKGRGKEVYVLSDLQDGGWQTARRFDEGAGRRGQSSSSSGSGPRGPENLAVTAVQYAAARPTAGVPFAIRPHLTVQGERAGVVRREARRRRQAGRRAPRR